MISIKTNEELELMRISGKINYETHELLKEKIKVGITTEELNNMAESFIKDRGGIPSFKGFEGYPKTICTSINEEVVHGIPNKRVLCEGDVISIDIGVIYKGFHSDAARTYIVGKSKNKKHELFLKATEEALKAGMKKVKSGVMVKDVSEAIASVAIKYNLGIVKELVGHGVGRQLHEEPDIPNFKNNSNVILKEGMTIAIEPMFTLGKSDVWLLDNDWTIATKDGKIAAHFEHTVAVTKTGYRIMTGE